MIVVVAVLLLLAMLIVGGRKSARLRSRHSGPSDGAAPYRSHAEASRRSDLERL